MDFRKTITVSVTTNTRKLLMESMVEPQLGLQQCAILRPFVRALILLAGYFLYQIRISIHKQKTGLWTLPLKKLKSQILGLLKKCQLYGEIGLLMVQPLIIALMIGKSLIGQMKFML